MNILQTTIMAIVEGITEFLPISSTGHLMLTAHILKLNQTDFMKSFEITIQFAAILSVVAIYWRKIIVDLTILTKVVAAFIPTGVIGFIFYKIVKQYLLSNTTLVLWTLILGGIALIVFELFHNEKDESIDGIAAIPYRKAVIIGLFQTIAMIPGISRSAATIVGGLVLGIKRKTIVEFSFLLAVPTMLTATVFDLYKNFAGFSADQTSALSIGFVLSFIFAFLSIKWLLKFIENHTFISFGIYRILAAVAFWLFILK